MKQLFVTIVFLTACGMLNAQTKVQIGDLYYNLSGAYASVARSNYTKESYIIPSNIAYEGNDYIVTSIANKAFFECSLIKEIRLPNTITSIGFQAFQRCYNLESMIIPESVLSFSPENDNQYFVFADCNKLREIIYLPSSAPQYWESTSFTYVPDLLSYTSPKHSINNASIIEMISFTDKEFFYTGQAPTTTWVNNIDGYTASLSMPMLSSEVGSYEEWIPVTFTKDEESFTANVVYRYTIKPVKLTAKVTNTSREYGEDNPQFNITYSGFLSGDNENVITTKPTINTTATKTSNVGEYPITISGGVATNYEFVYEPGVLTITKAALSAKVDDATKVYGAQNPAFTITYYGLKNNESAPAWTTRPTFQTDATQVSGVGQYEVKALNGVPVNYDLGDISAGTLSITTAPLTIKANDAARQYYSEEPNFSYTCNGFVNGENESVFSTSPVLSTSANLKSNVGTYEIKVSETTCQNYSISHINGTLTITPRTLIASVGNYERMYNEENPEFEVKYNGFVGDEDEKVLSQKATANTAATKSSDVGTYTINVTGGSAENYKFSYTSGTLTINKAEQTILWEQDLSDLKVGDQVELLATVSSGLPITYTMDSNNAAEIYSAGTKTYLDCKAGGQFSIRAVQNGNKNYYSSPRASNMVYIVGSNPTTDPMLTIKQADNGFVSTQVSKGSVYTFTVNPSSGWKIHSVTFNDSDVTNQLSSNNTFTTPAIYSNSTLSVVYEQGENSAVSAARQSEVKIHGMSFGVRVLNANTNDIIRVFSTDSILQKSVKAEGQITDIPLPDGKVYIVKVGSKTVKLSL